MILKQTLSRRASPARMRVLIASLCAFVALSACDSRSGIEITQEISEPNFVRGKQLERSGRYQEALEAFIKVIDRRGSDPGAPESHFEVGEIFLQNIKDPYSAVYHFKRYLDIRPNSPQAPQVRQLIESAEKEVARSMPGDPFGAQTEKADMQETIGKLKKQNDDLTKRNEELTAQLARLGGRAPTVADTSQGPARPPANTARPPATGNTTNPPTNSQPLPADYGPSVAAVPVDQPTAPAQNPPANTRPPTQPSRPNSNVATPPAASGRTYTAQPGDTLYKISVKFYGTGSRWQAILDANSDQLRSVRDLKIGMVLKIP